MSTDPAFRPDPQNANKGTARGQSFVNRSLRERGAARSGVAANDGTMIAGSQTLGEVAALGLPIRAVHTRGDEWIVVVRDDIEPGSEAARLLAIEDNRSSEVGLAWDPAVLATLDPPLLEGLWRPEELAELLATIPPDVMPGGGGDAFAGEPNPEQTRVQPGDIWQVGEHRIGCLDCTDPAALARLLGDAVPTFVWSDPPYGIGAVDPNSGQTGGLGRQGFSGYPFGGVKGEGKGIRNNKYAPVIGDSTPDTAIAAFTLQYELWPKALHIWWGANHYAHALPPSPCWLVWDKETDAQFADAELAWCSHDGAVRVFTHKWSGLIKASERGEARLHPTQKPVALPEWAFGKYGKADDIIFDGFAGSGISLIAAHRAGGQRRVFACELSAAYVDVVLTRAEAEGIAPITRRNTIAVNDGA